VRKRSISASLYDDVVVVVVGGGGAKITTMGIL